MSALQAQLMGELEAIRKFLGAAQDSLKTGYMPDITGLEKRIADVCVNVQKADAAVQKQCLPELSVLLQTLDECERGLKQWHADATKSGSGS